MKNIKYCLNCDNQIIKKTSLNKYKKKKFCSYNCFREFNIKQRPIKFCLICNKKIVGYRYKLIKQRFCSKKCVGKYHTGENHVFKFKPLSKEVREKIRLKKIKYSFIEKYCISCNSQIKQDRNRPSQTKDRKFCSNGCRAEFYKKYPELSKLYVPKIKKQCNICKKEFEVLPCYNKRTLCSLKCRNIHFIELMKLINSLPKRKESIEKMRLTKKRLYSEGKIIPYWKIHKKSQEHIGKYTKPRPIKYCKSCNKIISAKYVYLINRSRFCSQKCHHNYTKGENHPFYNKKLSEEHIKKMIIGWNRKPNKKEIQLFSIINKYYPNEFALNTKGEVMILGRKVPDIVNINGKKVCIEGFHDYWKIKSYGSVENYIKQRSEHFAKYGFRTIFIDYKELKNEEAIIDKIKNIIN